MDNINNVLLRHVAFGSGPAIGHLKNIVFGPRSNIEFKYEELLGFLQIFFNSRTDTRRLIYSQRVSQLILEIFDMSELNTLRKNVGDIELSRIIKYEKQRDYTSHTVYLFLLGIWLYDSIEQFREAFKAKVKP